MTKPTNQYQIWFHHYELKKKTSLNAHDKISKPKKGVLIKIEDDFGNYGISELSTWPEFGDLDLNDEISIQGKLYQQAIGRAEIDLEARKNKIKLITEKPTLNNILISDFKSCSQKLNPALTYKIKGNREIASLAEFLNSKADQVFKFRIDFNYSLNEIEFSKWFDLLDKKTIDKIEYVEDPFIFNFGRWTFWNQKIKLALDWDQTGVANWDYRILKPTRDEQKFQSKNFSLTSMMDHPVGLAFGLMWAQKYPERIHGFLTLDLFEETAFHSDFASENEKLHYKSNGFGIGFEKQIQNIQWIPQLSWKNKTQLFLVTSPKLSPEEKKHLFDIKNEFIQKIENANQYVLIPSSGTTQNEQQTVKVIALEYKSILNSAGRVNQFSSLVEGDHWGCVLPLDHIGGLSILARASLSQSKVFFLDWKNFTVEWLVQNKITVLSLVPTQLYDIVQRNLRCPEKIKVVFLGGGSVSEDLWNQAKKLNWSIVQTFGMTETASMIAYKNDFNSAFKVLPNVSIESVNQRLKVSCDSLAGFFMFKNLKTNEISIQCHSVAGSLLTDDMIELVSSDQFNFIQRDNEYIKILGEGVSLPELRCKIDKLISTRFKNKLDPRYITVVDVVHLRKGFDLVCVVADQLRNQSDQINQLLQTYNEAARPNEKIQQTQFISKWPMTDLGKIKFNTIKEILKNEKA